MLKFRGYPLCGVLTFPLLSAAKHRALKGMALSKGRQGIVDAAGETQVFLPVGEVYHLLVIIQLDTIEARAYKAVLKQIVLGKLVGQMWMLGLVITYIVRH